MCNGVVMGSSGKTAFLRRFIKNSFSNDYCTTIGATFVSKTIDYKDSRIELQVCSFNLET